MRSTRHRLQAAMLASGLLHAYFGACAEQALLIKHCQAGPAEQQIRQVYIGCCQAPLASSCVGRMKSGPQQVCRCASAGTACKQQ